MSFAKYIVQNMAADAILHGATLQPIFSASAFPSLATVPQLISMNIHYSMIFLLPRQLLLPPLSRLHPRSLIYNCDRQLRDPYKTFPFYCAVREVYVLQRFAFEIVSKQITVDDPKNIKTTKYNARLLVFKCVYIPQYIHIHLHAYILEDSSFVYSTKFNRDDNDRTTFRIASCRIYSSLCALAFTNNTLKFKSIGRLGET